MASTCAVIGGLAPAKRMTDGKIIAEMVFLMNNGLNHDTANKQYRREWGLQQGHFTSLWKKAKNEFNTALHQAKRHVAQQFVDSLDHERLAMSTMKREEALSILADIARGKATSKKKAKNAEGETIIVELTSTINERIAAIRTMSEIEGWNSPIKIQESSVVEFRDAE